MGHFSWYFERGSNKLSFKGLTKGAKSRPILVNLTVPGPVVTWRCLTYSQAHADYSLIFISLGMQGHFLRASHWAVVQLNTVTSCKVLFAEVPIVTQVRISSGLSLPLASLCEAVSVTMKRRNRFRTFITRVSYVKMRKV